MKTLVNINTADAGELQSLDGIDEGIAERIIDHRNSQGNFQNVDQLKEVKLITDEEFRSIVDKITTKMRQQSVVPSTSTPHPKKYCRALTGNGHGQSASDYHPPRITTRRRSEG